MKKLSRFLDLTVVAALSLLILATLVHAAGLLPTAAAAAQALR